MAVTIKSDNSTDALRVDTNKAAYVRIKGSHGNDIGLSSHDKVDANQEYLMIAGKNDSFATPIRTDRRGNQIFGNYTSELIEPFEGATLNVQKWTATNTTFSSAQSTLGGYNFNNTSVTTVNAVAVLSSQRLFYKVARMPLQIKLRLRHSLVSGAIADFGFGVPTTTTLLVPNGTQVRFLTSGSVQLVQTINSVEISTANVISQITRDGNTAGAALDMSDAYFTSGYFVYDLIVDDDGAWLTIQDTTTDEIIGIAELAAPKTQYKMWGATALPFYARVYNNTAPASAPVFQLTDLQILSTDLRQTPDASQLAGQLGLTAGRNPFTGAQLENHTNSTAPTSATLSNTAAGYSALGGRFQFAAVAGAATDYALFAIAVPAGARFLCEGITIDTYNTGAAVATTGTVLEWAMGFNSSAVSLATANIIRRQIGVQNFPVGAAVGAQAQRLDVKFETPEPVESGRFIHVILNMPIGTATASQIIRGTVLVKGRFI